jgi:putative hemolysin
MGREDGPKMAIDPLHTLAQTVHMEPMSVSWRTPMRQNRTTAPRLVAYVGHELHQRAVAYCEQTGYSLSFLMMDALREYLDARAPKGRKGRKG